MGDDNTRRPKLASGKNVINTTPVDALVCVTLAGILQCGAIKTRSIFSQILTIDTT